MRPEPTPNSPEGRVEGRTGLARLAALTKRVLKAPKLAPTKPKAGSRGPKRRRPKSGKRR